MSSEALNELVIRVSLDKAFRWIKRQKYQAVNLGVSLYGRCVSVKLISKYSLTRQGFLDTLSDRWNWIRATEKQERRCKES